MTSCSICEGVAQGREIRVRSGKRLTLWHCPACDYEFFAHDPSAALADDRLDETRLRAAGLDVPPVDKDFSNGLRQSQAYIREYVDAADRGRDVLEVGCSWGYFLTLLRDAGARPRGVELNTVRARYVNETLGIRCDGNLETCEREGSRFRKIFMFYVLEYVQRPAQYLQRLLDLLDADGKLVLITPNLRDPLRDLWRNEAFGNFFYDEHAVNYLSPRSVQRLLGRLRKGCAEVATRQGYSFVNHLSWFLTSAPRTTGLVGGDEFVRDVVAKLRSGTNDRAAHLARVIQDFDAEYRHYLEAQQLGNQIRVTLWPRDDVAS